MKIEIEPGQVEVYDIEIEDYHNFALTAGVFVHNSSEDRLGLPFVGRSGKLLIKWIQELGIEEWACINCLKCHTNANRRPKPHEIETCRPFLDKQLALLRPELVVCLGQTAATTMGFKYRGILQRVGEIHCYKGTIQAMSFVHPSYCLRNPNYKVPLNVIKEGLR
jgi:DNA polymerase